ncbi:putative Ubiquinone/menaquinone biosynthesis C-methyltransferase UbiE [Blattamonas nauphoetae]|uniref:Ubiquinone/menaquinone biosynthesis C-methyltransferase UbiE n=1 Tax=Blattamonas nauphoetae TaxID=2049346 RepID=A0ABQ9YEU3_9EUKA|nr:putative Ubiquinone/menaquinone biosynthesis C-methyltransferase UbiE [Blattamonas nauphoetae]
MAPIYDTSNKELMKPVVKHILQTVSPFTSESVVHDNACGTAVVTESIFEHLTQLKSPIPSFPIHCTDLSPAMLEKTSEKIAHHAWKNVTTQVMDAGRLSFPDNTFTHSFTNFGIFFLPDPPAGTREIFRTLKPGGVAYVTAWIHFGHMPALREVTKIVRPDLAPYPPPIVGNYEEEGAIQRVLEEGGFTGQAGTVTVEKFTSYQKGRCLEDLGEFWWTMHGFSKAGWTSNDKTRWIQALSEELFKVPGNFRDEKGVIHVQRIAMIGKAIKS